MLQVRPQLMRGKQGVVVVPAPTTHPQPSGPAVDAAVDCRHYLGVAPCQHQRACRGCPHYQALGPRLCVLKSGPLHELIDSLALLPELRRRHPESHLTWITSRQGMSLLQGHPGIDRLLSPDPLTCLELAQQQFDLVINLDLAPGSAALASSLFAKRRRGIALSSTGKPYPGHPEAQLLMPWLLPVLEPAPAPLSYPNRLADVLNLVWRKDRPTLPVPTDRRDVLARQLIMQGWQPQRPTFLLDGSTLATLAPDPESLPALAQFLCAWLRAKPELQLLLLAGAPELVIGRGMTLWDRVLEYVAQAGGQDLLKRLFPLSSDADPCHMLVAIDLAAHVLLGPGLAAHLAVALGKPFLWISTDPTPPALETCNLAQLMILQPEGSERLLPLLRHLAPAAVATPAHSFGEGDLPCAA